MRVLYAMSSADSWEQPMSYMMGAIEPGVAPGRNDFSPMAAFAIAWMFAGYIFAINLFVGVVVDNFSRLQVAATPPLRRRYATTTPPPRHRHATATPPPRHQQR